MYAYLGLGTFSETTNRFANITVSQNSSTIVCTFINWQNGSNSTCTVHVYCPNINDGCDKIIYSTHNILYTTTSSSDSDTVTIEITDFHQVPSIVLYCFIVIASNGSFMAEVIGSFNTTG